MDRFLRLSVAPVCVASLAAVTLLWPSPDSKLDRNGLIASGGSRTARQQLDASPASTNRGIDARIEVKPLAPEQDRWASESGSSTEATDATTRSRVSQSRPATYPSALNPLPLVSDSSMSDAKTSPLRLQPVHDNVEPMNSGTTPKSVAFEPTSDAFPLFNAPSNAEDQQTIADNASAAPSFDEGLSQPEFHDAWMNTATENTHRKSTLPTLEMTPAVNDAPNVSNDGPSPQPPQPKEIQSGTPPAWNASIRPEHTIDIENAVVADAAGATIEVTRVSLNPAVLERVRAHVEKGNEMARKGALFSSRTEFQQALFVLAEARAGQLGNRQALDSLQAAWQAITEADDFVATNASQSANLTLTDQIARHQTRLLTSDEAELLTPYEAMQLYLEFAQRQLVIAAGLEPIASDALYGLGKIYIMPQGLVVHGEKMVAAKAIVMFQAALQTNPEHARAASELATQFAKIGELSAAKDLYVQSLIYRPAAVTWRNLAVVHQRLGESELAQQALNEANLAAQQDVQDPSNSAVRLVPQEQFEQASRGSITSPQRSLPNASNQAPSVPLLETTPGPQYQQIPPAMPPRSSSIQAPSIQAPSLQTQSNPMQANPMQANPMQANPMQANPMQANPMQANPMQPTPYQAVPNWDASSATIPQPATPQINPNTLQPQVNPPLDRLQNRAWFGATFNASSNPALPNAAPSMTEPFRPTTGVSGWHN